VRIAKPSLKPATQLTLLTIADVGNFMDLKMAPRNSIDMGLSKLFICIVAFFHGWSRLIKNLAIRAIVASCTGLTSWRRCPSLENDTFGVVSITHEDVGALVRTASERGTFRHFPG